MGPFGIGPQAGLFAFLDGSGMDPNEDQEFLQSKNPQPIDPLNQNQFDPNAFGLQTQVNDQTFQPDTGMTLQEMLAQRDLQSAQPSLSQADSPLSFQYQNEEYPNSSGSKLYRDRLGPFSDKRQVEDPDAYYNQARNIETLTGNPFMGNRDRYDDAPFARQSGDYYAGDYVNYDETIDRPYQGDWEWQKGYEPDLKGRREYDPMLMEAFINQRNGLPQNLGVKKNVSEPTIDYSNVMGRDLEANEGAQIVNGLKQPYTMRGQLAKDFSKDGIPKDFIDGLRLAGSELNEDFGNIKGKIGTGFDNLKTGIFNNPLTRGAGTAFNFLRGSVPGMLMSGLGAIFNRDPNAPSYQKYSPQSYLKENNLSNIYNANPSMINDFYDSNEDSDTFGTTRFDRAKTAFGKSRALFGPNGIAATKAKMAKAKADKAKAQQAQLAREASTANRAMARNPQVYRNAGITSGGFASQNTGTNSNFSNKTGRGRTGYSEGGLASMFTRRR
jgi:hypothetical protein